MNNNCNGCTGMCVNGCSSCSGGCEGGCTGCQGNCNGVTNSNVAYSNNRLTSSEIMEEHLSAEQKRRTSNDLYLKYDRELYKAPIVGPIFTAIKETLSASVGDYSFIEENRLEKQRKKEAKRLKDKQLEEEFERNMTNTSRAFYQIPIIGFFFKNIDMIFYFSDKERREK